MTVFWEPPDFLATLHENNSTSVYYVSGMHLMRLEKHPLLLNSQFKPSALAEADGTSMDTLSCPPLTSLPGVSLFNNWHP